MLTSAGPFKSFKSLTYVVACTLKKFLLSSLKDLLYCLPHLQMLNDGCKEQILRILYIPEWETEGLDGVKLLSFGALV